MKRTIAIFQVDENGNLVEQNAVSITYSTTEVRCVRTSDHYSPAEYEGGNIDEIMIGNHDATKEILSMFTEDEILNSTGELETTEDLTELMEYDR